MLTFEVTLKELKKAFKTSQLFMVYQPILDLHSLKITGLEALMRWHSTDMGIISPKTFISLMERNGKIFPVEKMVTASPWRDASAWPDDISLSINFSAIEFCEPELSKRIRNNLKEFGIFPGRCEVEITETTPMSDSIVVINNIRELKNMGVKLSLDDFGTGNSNLSYLLRYPFDTLKIDKEFILNIEPGSKSEKIVEGVIKLAHDFGMDVLAEGVESKEQIDLLMNMGCDKVQGFYFGRPVIAEEISFLLEQYNS